MSDVLLVRLRAYDPRRGHVLRRFAYRGVKFHEERGWYRVPREVAEYLRGVRQVPGDEHTPPAFDVMVEEEAREVEARESAERASRASPVDTAAVITTDELTRPEESPKARGGRR